MSKGEVIDFEILRIQNELEYFHRTNSLPHSFLDGRHDIDELLSLHYVKLSAKHQELADLLKKDYGVIVSKTMAKMKRKLSTEYLHLMNNLASEHKSFRFDFMEEKYRPGLNPLRALYYEVREVSRRYNSENPDHQWIVGILTDGTYKRIVIHALNKDIRKLEKLVKTFYRPMVLHTKGAPLELFHVKQMLSDFILYRETFLEFNITGFDE
jgi:hypothetical protein